MASSRTLFLSKTPLWLGGLLCALSGCQSMFGSNNVVAENEQDDYFYAEDERTKSRNPVVNFLRPILVDDTETLRRRRYSAAGRRQVELAQQAYDQGNPGQTAKLLKPIIKGRDYLYTPAREDALYLRGKVYYENKQYADAEEDYGNLLKDYPNSRHTDEITRNLFSIAKVWLNNSEFASSSEIQTINYERPDATPPPGDDVSGKPLSYRVPILPNFTDDSRPYFDTQGRAMNTLRTIWMRDPTGALADDALMLAATYFFRRGQYREADRYFAILRAEYPKSPHLESAFVLGSQVKLMSYQGAAYDANTLEEAEKLKTSTLRLFPGSKDAGMIRTQLEKVEEMKARRDWEKVLFYQSKGKPQSIAVYCALIIRNHPQSSYAPRARQILAQLPPEHRVGMDALLGTPLPIQPSPSVTAETTPPVTAPPATDDRQPPRFFPRFPFRRVPQPEESPQPKPLPSLETEGIPLEALDRLEREPTPPPFDEEPGTAAL